MTAQNHIMDKEADKPTPGPLDIQIDNRFRSLLATQGVSVALTVGPDGLLLIGINSDGKIHVEHKCIPNAFAIAVEGSRLAVSTKQGITVYSKSTKLASSHPDHPNLYDAYFTPLVTFHTGDCLLHDMAPTRQGLVVANTRFSTVCLIDGRYNINPIWHPSFISIPMPEDRCHLNGLAVSDERLRYVTAFGPFDIAGGWRNQSEFHGVLIDAVRDRNLVEGLSLPHSPRIFSNRLFVCESGYGAVLEIDQSTGSKRCLAKLPGLTRGLSSSQGVLFVGLSTFRFSQNSWKLPIGSLGEPLKAGIAAIDANTGEVIGMATILNPDREVLDVKVIPNVRCPGISDADDPNEFHLIDGPMGSYWVRTLHGKPGK